MARTIINETELEADVFENAAAAGVYQTGDNANGMYLVDDGKAGTLVLHFKNTNGATRDITIKAGTGGHLGSAWRAGLGDLAVTVAATSGEQMIFLTDTARFKQSDGTINIDISGADTTVAAFRLSQ